MKKSSFAALFIIFTALSCSKDNNPSPPGTTNYMSTSVGSTWNYEMISNDPPAPVQLYTLTSTNRDTTVSSGGTSKTFHVYSNNNGPNEYQNQSGNSYSSFQALPAGLGDPIDNLYLKTDVAVNQTWTQSYTVNVQGIDVPITVVNKIVEKGVSRTVNAITYNDVIHVSTTISSLLLPGSALTTNIHSYYAPNVGLIQNTSVIDINYMGFTDHSDTETRLKTSNIL